MNNNDLMNVVNNSLATFDQAIDAMLTGLSGMQQFQQTIVSQYEKISLELESQGKKIELQQKQIDELREHLNKAEEALKAKIFREKEYEGYVNQTEFGRLLSPNVSSIRVGRLLQAVGLAYKHVGNNGKTYVVPYRDKEKAGFAKIVRLINIHPRKWYYVWNYDKCMTYIEQWLTDRGLYDAFKSHEYFEEREKFIDDLYDEYVGDRKNKHLGYKSCERCGKTIFKNSNAQKYCKECAQDKKREFNREYVRQLRLKLKELDMASGGGGH